MIIGDFGLFLLQSLNNTVKLFSMEYFLGIDWGGTYIKAGVVDGDGRIARRFVYSSGEFKKKNAFISKISNVIKDVKEYRVKSVGVGAPGLINVEEGFIYYLPNIKGWEKYPLKKVLENKINLPAYIDTDANVFTLAEFLRGAAQGVQRGIFLTLGTGLGGGLILNGMVFRGRTSAAELGHFPIDPRGDKCGCGAIGCVETFVGNRYLENKYRSIKKSRHSVTVKEIFQRMRDGDKAAAVVVEEFSSNLGRFLAGLVNIFNPEKIIIGGGISASLPLFKPYLWREIKRQAMGPNIKGLRIVRAKLKSGAGVIGAALFAKEMMKKINIRQESRGVR